MAGPMPISASTRQPGFREPCQRKGRGDDNDRSLLKRIPRCSTHLYEGDQSPHGKQGRLGCGDERNRGTVRATATRSCACRSRTAARRLLRRILRRFWAWASRAAEVWGPGPRSTRDRQRDGSCCRRHDTEGRSGASPTRAPPSSVPDARNAQHQAVRDDRRLPNTATRRYGKEDLKTSFMKKPA